MMFRAWKLALVITSALAVQLNAHAAVDWDARVNAAFQSLQSTPTSSIASLSNTSSPPLNRNMTLFLAMARQHWSELSAATQAMVRPYTLRPTDAIADATNFEYPWQYGDSVESIHPTTHFRIHYIDKANYSSDPNAADATFVTTVAQVVEAVWNEEVNTLGYGTPPSDSASTTNGGDGLFDVYLSNLGPHGLYGYVSAEGFSSDTTRPNGVYSYMVLDNDYQNSEYHYVDPTLPLKVTAAHEFFHAVQNGYDYTEDIAFMEQSATWMEDIVYPDVHDNYAYLGEPYVDANGDGQYTAGVDVDFTDRNGNGIRDEGSIEYPEASLDAFDQPPLVQYGRFVWIRYLSENYTNNIVKTIWEQCGQSAGDNTYSSIDDALQQNGSTLATAYQDYASWGYDKSKFSDGVNYPLVWVDRTVSGNAVSISSSDSPTLAFWAQSGYSPQLHLSTIYTQIQNPSGTYSFSSSNGTAALTMLVDLGDGQWRHDVISLSNGAGSWGTPAGATQAVAVISNVAVTAGNMSWSFYSGALIKSKKKSGGGAWMSAMREPEILWMVVCVGALMTRRVALRRRQTL